MVRPCWVDERALILVSIALLVTWSVENVVWFLAKVRGDMFPNVFLEQSVWPYLLVGRRNGQPVTASNGMDVIHRVVFPIPCRERMVKANGKANNGHPTNGIEDCELRAGGSTPF